MNDYQKIQCVIEKLNNDIEWKNSFIKEFYLSGHRYLSKIVDDEETVHIGDGGFGESIRMVLGFRNNEPLFSIEFIFHGIEIFSINKQTNLNIHCKQEESSFHLKLSDTSYISARDIYVAFGNNLNDTPKLGYDMPSNDMVSAYIFKQAYRKCSSCGEQWIERPDILYSRCPRCNRITSLAIE